MEAPYSSEEEKMRLLDLYRYMHSRIHSTSRPLKLIYHVAERETLLAWVSSVLSITVDAAPVILGEGGGGPQRGVGVTLCQVG